MWPNPEQFKPLHHDQFKDLEYYKPKKLNKTFWLIVILGAGLIIFIWLLANIINN